ncbi:Parp [Bemisia tabaci toti-like virus 2]|uniref:Parp n=1 Tax=Bemisia tabaci toti-like virus 2 TaxID=2838154 RepID=A0A8E6Y957_9VIRU|nr:Parp [Bemisia tabaci toti-like virus 2]
MADSTENHPPGLLLTHTWVCRVSQAKRTTLVGISFPIWPLRLRQTQRVGWALKLSGCPGVKGLNPGGEPKGPSWPLGEVTQCFINPLTCGWLWLTALSLRASMMDREEVMLLLDTKQGGVQTGAGNTSLRSLASETADGADNVVRALASPNPNPIATHPSATSTTRPPRSVEGQVIGDAAGAALGAAVEFLTDGAATPEVVELVEMTSAAVNRAVDAETLGEVIDEAEGVVTGRKPSGKVPKVPDFLKNIGDNESAVQHHDNTFRENAQYAPHAPSAPPSSPPRQQEEDDDVRILRSVKKHDASVVLHPPLGPTTHGKGKGKKGHPKVLLADGHQHTAASSSTSTGTATSASSTSTASSKAPPPASGHHPAPSGGAPPPRAPGHRQPAAAATAHHSKGPRRPDHVPLYAPSVTRGIKFGDNSIVTDLVSDKPIYAIPPSDEASNFLSHGSFFCAGHQDLFELNVGTYHIQSRIIRADQVMQTRAPVVVNTSVFEDNGEALLEASTKTYIPTWGPAIQLGSVDASAMEDLRTGSEISARACANILNPLLGIIDPNFVAFTCLSMLYGEKVWDCSAMYTKLVYWALVLDYQGVAVNALAYPGFVANEDTVKWIDMTANPINSADTFREYVQEGYIFLREGIDFDRTEIQTILWMARSGYRVASAVGARTPDMCYVKWPSIRVCLLTYGAAPAAQWPGNVAAAAQTAQQLLQFAGNLANTRNEHYAFCRGAYYALDVIGVRYATRGAGDAARHYRMAQFMNLEPIQVPNPCDLHPFFRYMGKVPVPDDAHRKAEIECFCASSSLTRVQLACVYVSLMQKLSTTYLFSMSLTTADIVTYLNGGAPRGTAAMLLKQVFESLTPGAEPRLYSMPKRAMLHYTGWAPEFNLYPDARAQPMPCTIAAAADYYAAFAMVNDVAPRLSSLLSIDSLLLLRPQEWAILGPNTKVSFRSDLLRVTTAAMRGVYSHLGDSSYTTASEGGRPYLFLPYGVQMLNVLANFFDLADHNPRYSRATYVGKGGKTTFERNAGAYASHGFIANLHVFEPATVWTYDFGANEVRAPCQVGDNLSPAQAANIQLWQDGFPLPKVGFLLNRDPDFHLEGMDAVPGMVEGLDGLDVSETPETSGNE